MECRGCMGGLGGQLVYPALGGSPTDARRGENLVAKLGRGDNLGGRGSVGVKLHLLEAHDLEEEGRGGVREVAGLGGAKLGAKVRAASQNCGERDERVGEQVGRPVDARERGICR